RFGKRIFAGEDGKVERRRIRIGEFARAARSFGRTNRYPERAESRNEHHADRATRQICRGGCGGAGFALVFGTGFGETGSGRAGGFGGEKGIGFTGVVGGRPQDFAGRIGGIAGGTTGSAGRGRGVGRTNGGGSGTARETGRDHYGYYDAAIERNRGDASDCIPMAGGGGDRFIDAR